MTMGSQLLVQAIGVGATALWCGGVTWGILKLLDATTGLRVDADAESGGLDVAEHGETAYNG